VFHDKTPSAWVGEPTKREMLVAVPDSLFKIVIRDSDDPSRPDVLAFVYPQYDVGYAGSPYNHARYLRSVDHVEAVTGLDLLTALPDQDEAIVEGARALALWPRPGAPAAETAPVVDLESGKVNVNTASLEELQSLPGIGAVLARRIVEGRPYGQVGDLTRVRGIGKAKLSGIGGLVRVE